MVGGRSRGSPGMVLAVVLLMVMAAQTKGKSQLSIVEDIDKSLDNILLDVESLYEYIDPSTTSQETTPEGTSTTGVTDPSPTSRETTPDGASTTGVTDPFTTSQETTLEGAATTGVTSETSSEFSVPTTGTTRVDSSSTDISNATPDTTTTSVPASTASTTTASPTTTTATSTASPTTTTATSTASPTSTTATSTASPTTTTATSTASPTSTTATRTASPTSTTSTTTTTHPTTSTTTSADPTAITTETTDSTTSKTSTAGPSGPKSNDRVKRRNLLSLATLDDVLSAWVDPMSTWLEDKMATETANGTSDVPSESTIPTRTAVTTPVPDITRLVTALTKAHEVVTQVDAGTITEDQVGQIQAAEAEVKDVTESPDEALKEQLQNHPDYLDTLIEKIMIDQVTITETLDQLKKRNTTGIIVGSVIGGLVLVVLVAAGVVWYVRRKKKMDAGGRATAKKRSQSAAASSQQQMVELRTDHGMEDPYTPDEFRPHSRTPPNPLIPRANFDNFSLSSAQRNNPPESSRIPGRESPMQVGEMRTVPGIENPGYVEELPPRPVVPPKPRNRPSTVDDFGVSPSQIRIGQEPSRADFVPSEQTHYIDELNYRLAPRERHVRPIGGNNHSPTEPSRRSRRDRSPRYHQHHHHPRNHDHRMRHRNDHHVRRTPSMPPPDYTIPRNKHQSPDTFISRKPYSQKQQPPRSPYEFEAPQRPSAPPESEPPRPERNRSDIRRPYGPEDLY